MRTIKYLRPFLINDVKAAFSSLIGKRTGEICVRAGDISLFPAGDVAVVIPSSPLSTPHYIVHELERSSSPALRMQYRAPLMRTPDTAAEEGEESFLEGEGRK